MTDEEALVQTDLIGHDFYVFENSVTGLVNVVYHRKMVDTASSFPPRSRVSKIASIA
ncbi:MAG: sigma 54 modulation/S30EA ribosomal C-terminal domain-containing protein [Collinsella stercoris]|uniref:sigma 54 modulation/S30EA ribosomal C-terminal domain-containing protein n=1 Tax=Collinsella stercoris TaxID=147206 RepID=UPI003990E704